MKTRPLGTSDISVSALCLGCMLFGTSVDKETSFAILDAYYEAGGRFLDTSNNYAFWVEGGQGGESERLIGEWLAARGCRDDMVIATKLGAMRRPDGPAQENREGLSAKAIHRAVDESLQRMRLDHIDLLYSHVEDRSVPLEETIQALDAQVKAGKARVLGASNHATWRLERARKIAKDQGYAPYQAIQQRHSYLMPQRNVRLGIQKVADTEMFDYLTEEPDIMLVGYTVLLRGAYARGQAEKAYDTPENTEKMKVLYAVAQELGVTPNQVALAWAMQSVPLSVPLFTTSRLAHFPELLGALDVMLDEEIMQRLSLAGQRGV